MYSLEELDRIIERMTGLVCREKEPCNLYDPIGYMMSIGGKRIRPKMCLLTYGLFSSQYDNAILYPAMALEMFHEFTLLHDDIMDKSDTRRGHTTVYRKWNQNIAILSGDVMSIEAYRLLSSVNPKYLKKALDLFTEMAVQVCEGQQYDMDFESLPFITMDDYMSMIGLKTAVLIACSAKMGALLAGAPDEVCDALYGYGYQIGLAFQITDDYLDTFGDERTFGKKIGGDIANNKKTWLLVEAFRLADASRRETLEALLRMDGPQGGKKFNAMRKLYEDLGVKEKALEAMDMCKRKADLAIAGINLSDREKQQMDSFANQLIYREK